MANNLRRSRILGTGRCLPDREVTNKDLEALMDTSDEWIRQRTGIERRYFVEEGQMGADLAKEASEKAMERAGIETKDIEFIILATLSPDYFFPGTSCVLQERLNLEGIGALDIRTQCTGFIYALSIADQYIKNRFYDRILVVGVEIHSTGLDLTTRGREVGVLFGDGSGAVVMGPSEAEEKGVLSTHLHAEGRHAKHLWLEAPGSCYHPRIDHRMIDEGRHFPSMNGRAVFRHAITRFPEVINEALDANHYTINDLDLLILHQANLRISEYVAKKMGIPKEKNFNNIQRYGNTTAASIPIALDEAVEMSKLHPGSLLCLASFGSGFTWASALIRW